LPAWRGSSLHLAPPSRSQDPAPQKAGQAGADPSTSSVVGGAGEFHPTATKVNRPPMPKTGSILLNMTLHSFS